MEKKYLQVRKNNFFARWMNFIKQKFNKKTSGLEEIMEEATSIINKQNKFFEEIGACSAEKQELLDLQTEYERGNGELFMLSDEEIHELNLLYKRQVEELAKELEDKRIQLRKIKDKSKMSENV